jgi:hypothetical protein
MGLLDSMEQHYEKIISQGNLSEREMKFFRWLKTLTFGVYNFVKPLAIGLLMLYIFNNLKNVMGMQEAIYIALVVQIIFLRMILSKLS